MFVFSYPGCPTEISTSTTWFREVSGKCYHIIARWGCPDGDGCTLQEAQTICSSVFGSDTCGIVFEPTTLAISDAVLQEAFYAAGKERFWIGVNTGDLTYHSNGNPVSLASIPWANSDHPYSGQDCVYAANWVKKWYSTDCTLKQNTICEIDYSKMNTIC